MTRNYVHIFKRKIAE